MPLATLTRRSGPATREYKSLLGGETKVLDKGLGIVEAVVSVTGIEDRVGDIIMPGAYEKTLQQRNPKGVSHHDWETPVAKSLEIKELLPGDHRLPKLTSRGEPWPKEAGAVMVKMQYNLETDAGSDAYSNVKFFEEEQEWSIGYNVPKGGSRMVKGIRYIDTLDWYEWSDVLFGAMPLAGTHSVKSLGGMILGGGAPQVEFKALPGSYEERRDRVQSAVQDALGSPHDPHSPSDWVYIKGMFDDRVVVCHEYDGKSNEYEFSYAIVGDEVTLGRPRAVKVIEQVVPIPETTTPDETAMAEADTTYKADDEATLETKAETKPKPYDKPADTGATDDEDVEKKPDDEKPEGEKDGTKDAGYLSPSELDYFRDVAAEIARTS